MLIHEQLSGDFLPIRIGSDCKEEAWPPEVMYKVRETGGDDDQFYVCRNDPETTIRKCYTCYIRCKNPRGKGCLQA
jgi:hypothetical protein